MPQGLQIIVFLMRSEDSFVLFFLSLRFFSFYFLYCFFVAFSVSFFISFHSVKVHRTINHSVGFVTKPEIGFDLSQDLFFVNKR